MSASNARASSAHSTTSTLRPRNKRLISGLDGEDESPFDTSNNNAGSTRVASPISSLYNSRAASPIPPAHPQRSPNARGATARGLNASPTRNGSARSRKPAANHPTLWDALQGIASDFLGNDLAPMDPKDRRRVRRPLSRLDNVRSSSSGSPSTWGPSAPTSNPRAGDIGAGTREEQTAEFRARKRKDMLMGQETSYADSLGKFKRRLSDDRNSVSAPPGDNEDRDALVYVHHVKKDDTLAGITIRYNISANVLRKANRMWPNDTVQARQTLILPVDACGVKGRPANGPVPEVDLLGSESESLSTLQAVEVTAPSSEPPNVLPNGSTSRHTRDRTNSTSTHTTSSPAVSTTGGEPAWQHDSWVLLPGNTIPTEIARLSRKALGYFPPARRKSNSYSDLDTPSTSLDLVRTGTNEFSNSGRGAVSPQPSQRARRESNATNGYFPSYMTGPGGVGTMSRNVRFPGPAQDGLNKMFAKHLPDVAPPRNQNQLYQPELPLYTDEPTPTTSGIVTPAFPHSSGPNLNLNLENVGGAIESWVRRMASKASHASHEPRRVSVGTPGKGTGGIGDLIEMTDEFEIGADEEDEGDRGRQGSGGPSSTATSYFDGAAVRGRGKSGKAD